MPSRRELQQYEQEQAAAGWHSMTMLVQHVAEGGAPAPIAPTIMCRPGETQFGTLPVDASVFCGADVEYANGMYASGGLLFTAAAFAASAAINANQRRKAEAAARPQWRPWGRFPAIITNQRVLLMTEQWTTYDYQQLVMIEPNPVGYSVALHFESSYPIMLRGPWVPWATVAICATLFQRPWPPGYQVPPALQTPAPSPIPHPAQGGTGQALPEQHGAPQQLPPGRQGY